jgi:hypothetical protein
LNEEIKKLVQAELERANKINGDFHSVAEAYSIILEEYEEVEEELKKLKEFVDIIWHNIRTNYPRGTELSLDFYIKDSENLILEAIQLSAMLNKLKKIL